MKRWIGIKKRLSVRMKNNFLSSNLLCMSKVKIQKTVQLSFHLLPSFVKLIKTFWYFILIFYWVFRIFYICHRKTCIIWEIFLKVSKTPFTLNALEFLMVLSYNYVIRNIIYICCMQTLRGKIWNKPIQYLMVNLL